MRSFPQFFSHEPVQKHQKDPWTFMFCTYKKTLANQFVTGNFRYSLPSGTCCQLRHRCSMLRPWGCWSLHVIASKEECCGSKSGAQGPGHTIYYIIYNLDIYVQPQVSVNKLSTSLMMIDACAALDVLCLGTESVGDIGGEARALAQCTQLPGP